MNAEQITSTPSIAQLVEAAAQGSGSAVVIGVSELVNGYMTINVPKRLQETASYLKAEYSRYKRLISIDSDASDAVSVAYKTASGLYSAEEGKLADNIYDLSKATVALLVLRKQKSEGAFDTAAFELAKEIQAFGSLSLAAQKLLSASGVDVASCTTAITRKIARVEEWLDQYQDKYSHPVVTKNAPMLYMKHSVTKPRRGYRAMLKLPTGSGKTTKLLNPTIQSFLQAGKKVVVISHRRSIIKNITIPELVDYENVEIGQMKNAQGLKIVVNSLTSAKFTDFLRDVDLVIIDEAAQVIDHALEGSVDQPGAVWFALKQLVWNANSVIFADADCNDECLDLIKKNDQHISIYETDQAHSEIKCRVGALDEVRAMAIKAAIDGHKILVAIDIAKDAEAMGKVLEKAGLQPLVITSKSAGWPAQAAFIANPNTDQHPIVIYSPAITSALSITSGHFAKHFGLFAGSVTPRSAIQMLRRDRTAQEFVIGLRNPQSKTQEVVQAQYDASLKSEFDEARYAHRKRTSWLRDNIQHTLPQELKRQGFVLEEIAVNDEVSIEGWKANKTGRRAAKTDTAKLLLDAIPATEGQAKRTINSGSNNEQEHFAAIRFFAESALKSKDLSYKDCLFWGEGGGQTKLNNFRKLHTSPITKLDELLQKLYQGHLAGGWKPEHTADLYKELNDIRAEVLLAGYEMPRHANADHVDSRHKQATITAILKAHGLQTKRRDGGKEGYYYIFDDVCLAQMKGYTGL